MSEILEALTDVLPLQLDYPVVVAAIFVSGVGGTFQYGFSISVMTSPSAVSPPKSSSEEEKENKS